MLWMIVFFPMAGAAAAYLAGRRNERARAAAAVLVTAVALALTLLLPGREFSARIDGILVFGLSLRTDGFRAVYAVIAAFMWFMTTLFSPDYFRKERENLGRYVFFLLVTLGATEGVMLSGDLMTAFVFFEILSFTSFTWVIHEETPEAVRAGYTYLFIAVIGGLVLFMGLLLLQTEAGTLSFDSLEAAAASVPGGSGNVRILAAGFCILFGFGAKAGMFPVHVWLPKAHPVAPSPASALLSGILTKVGIYGILMTSLAVFRGNEVFGLSVFVLGEITMFLGALLALFSVNLKRTLACSSMSQIGFILTGISMTLLLGEHGEAAELALSGVMLHMVNHSLIKLALFMAAGVVVMNLHVLTLDDIRGFGRKKPLLKAAFALGALGISGVPMFNGYISKTMLHEGIVEAAAECAGYGGLLRAGEWVFLISGGITFAYMLKLFLCVFVEKNRDEARQADFDSMRGYMTRLSGGVIFGSSLLMVILGQPAVMTRLAALMTGEESILEFRAFTAENLKGGGISLAIGAVLYLLVVRKVLCRRGSYVNLWPQRLDLENLLYRPLLTKILPGIFGTAASVFGENRILRPAAKGILAAGSVAGRILSDSTDALVVLLRRTVARERNVKAPDEGSAGFWWKLRQGTAVTWDSITRNFSFAMLMTCLGILVVLGVMVLLTVLNVKL